MNDATNKPQFDGLDVLLSREDFATALGVQPRHIDVLVRTNKIRPGVTSDLVKKPRWAKSYVASVLAKITADQREEALA